MLYQIALFMHVVGAQMLSAALGVDWLCVAGLRKARTIEMAKNSMSTFEKLIPTVFIALFLILVTGIYLTVTAWRWSDWIIATFVAIVLIAVFGAMAGRKIKAMTEMARHESKITPALLRLLTDGSLLLSLRIRTALFLGIVYLMTARPEMKGSLITLVVCLVVGLLPLTPKARQEVADYPERAGER